MRAVAIAIAVASVTIAACDKQEKPAADPRPKAAASVADSAEVSTVTCVEGDIECEERIYQLEETLFAYEAGVAKQVPEAAQSCWKADSDAFRQLVDDCKNLACKERALLNRISSLHFLQPAEQRAALKLPQTPSLLTVLAPDAATRTPPDAKLLFEARGGLIHAREHPEHMGIAVSSGDKNQVFLYDMDIGNHPGQDEIMGMVGASPTAQVLVRGQRLVAPTGVANFDPSQCRWVYELP
jgi:hypothetical protein